LIPCQFFPKVYTLFINIISYKGQYPPQLSKLQSQLSKFETALKKKGETLLQGMTQNYGSTVQELPNIKLPSIMSNTRGIFKLSNLYEKTL